MEVINTNIASLQAQMALNGSQDSMNTALQRLSTGLRINSAADDAAGLAISQRMTAQVNGTNQAAQNANDGVSLAQTAQGALGQMNNLLQRIRELAVESANATNTASDRQSLNDEVTQLTAELDGFARTTNFNGLNLLDGSATSSTFQIGPDANQTITTTTANFRTNQYGAQQIGIVSGSSFAVSATSITGPLSGAGVTKSGSIVIKGGPASGAVKLGTKNSAYAIANAINQQTQTGVTASAITTTTVTFSASGTYTLNVWGSNTTAQQITFNLSAANTATGLAGAVTSFNNQSSVTGITAQLNSTGTGVILTSAEGDNISLSAATKTSDAGKITAGGASLAANTSGTLTIAGNVILDADVSYTVTSSGSTKLAASIFGTAVASGGQVASTLQSVASLSVSSFQTATEAIRICDAALAAVNGQQASFGAIQNRFSATISNLQTSSTNLQASRSRIQDADFASETANFTQAQILQQAGTAMLAQANTVPQQVLTLLQHLP